MRFDVKVLSKAEADIRAITNFIFERSPAGAAAWLDAFRRARIRLAKDADSCGEAEENEHFEIDVRQAFFKTLHGRPYRLVFTIAGSEVRILRVRGPGQAPIAPEDSPG